VLKIFGWVDQREHDVFKVRGEAIRRVKIVFEAADYDLPEPIYRLNLMNSDLGGLLHVSEGQPEPAAGAPAATAAHDAEELDADVDLSRDVHLDREVAEERAEMGEADMLSPDAPKE
ncbi:MAG: hypothetical protein JJ899_10165, partial [Alphaproteobacteria bacterium]|nr:hypothetical protein [Alphaproteobacteria bacterium]